MVAGQDNLNDSEAYEEVKEEVISTEKYDSNKQSSRVEITPKNDPVYEDLSTSGKFAFNLKVIGISILAMLSLMFFYYLGKASLEKIDENITHFTNRITAPFLIIPFSFLVLAILLFISSTIYESNRKGSPDGLVKKEKKQEEKLRRMMADKEAANFNFTQEQVSKLHAEIENRLKDDSALKFIDDIKNNIRNQAVFTPLDFIFNGAIDNVQKKASKTRSYAVVNLFIGIVISGFAITLLVYSALYMPSAGEEDLWVYLSSRLAISLSAQLLALFFLKLYKNNLSELKYIQNEVTNFEAKKIAVMLSYDFSEKNKMSVVSNLMSTERNYILDKDKSTAHLEQLKLENSDSNSYLKIIEGLISSSKKEVRGDKTIKDK